MLIHLTFKTISVALIHIKIGTPQTDTGHFVQKTITSYVCQQNRPRESPTRLAYKRSEEITVLRNRRGTQRVLLSQAVHTNINRSFDVDLRVQNNTEEQQSKQNDNVTTKTSKSAESRTTFITGLASGTGPN
ncbi:hypothetical protein BaRGS_00005182 [Batillaria attramentaria]|uniref:Uncharacterized protein n=1 Tax=Batillaria attramentaria TaxID=370345 RepID=A0ABD0LWZ8_9CAEN